MSTSKMSIGFCHLCGKHGELLEGHVWPQFAYKRYISDVTKGGGFVDLRKGTFDSYQATQYWFCCQCEQTLCKHESYAARVLSRIESKPTETHAYDNRLPPFVTSISWRVTKYFQPETSNDQLRRSIKKACRRWRDYLRERKNDLGVYSQHAFIAFGEKARLGDAEWHKCVGGAVDEKRQLVWSRLGPLLIIGMFGKSQMTLPDIKIWERSKVSHVGGALTPIYKQRPEAALTSDFAQMLNEFEAHCIQMSGRMPGS